MPSTIVKCDPDVDLFMVWSSIVEAPTFIGTEAELRAERSIVLMNETGDRVERAKRTGTSALWPSEQKPDMGWRDDYGAIYQQQGVLRRCDFLAFAQLYPDVADLLEPFEDDESTPPHGDGDPTGGQQR